MITSFESRRHGRSLASLVAAGFVLASCGGGTDAVGDSTAGDPADTARTSIQSDDEALAADTMPSEAGSADDETGASTDAEQDTEAAVEAEGGTYEPGGSVFRAANLLDRPVDIYVRTTGLVKAFAVQDGLVPGAVSDFVAPPEGGSYVVTEAGTGDPTCVVDCDHFIATLTAYPENGPTYTAVLYDDEFSGASAIDLWEEAGPDRDGNSNAMPAADPGEALAVVTAIAVTGADFGLRLSVDGVHGCLDPIGRPDILVGGNQTLAFAFSSVTSFTLHDQPDQDCSAAPVGGPFDFAGEPSSRSHVLLSGSPGSLEAIVLPMVVGGAAVPAEPGDEGETADAGARDLAIGFMESELATEFGLEGGQLTCVAELVVDGLGTDVLLVEGEFVDLPALGDEEAAIAGAALVDSVDACGVDPSVYTG